MSEKSQVDHLMDDLRLVDGFFRQHDYHRWRDDLDSCRESLQKGFDALDNAELTDGPNLVYRDVLSYGQSPTPPGDGKRFFVDVALGKGIDQFDYAYHISVRPFPPTEASSVEIVERQFVMPVGVYRRDKPLQRMFEDLENAL
jgi:hypothetical protein